GAEGPRDRGGPHGGACERALRTRPFEGVRNPMKAWILSAGEGTRMRPLTANLPKPLLPVAGKPFLAHTIEALRGAGIGEMAVAEVEDPAAFGVVELDGDRVVGLEEKPKAPKSKLINAGVYLFPKEIFGLIDRTPKSARGEFEITDTIRLLMADQDVFAYR